MTTNPSPETAREAMREYLTFFIDGVEWALGLEHVREVISYDDVTRVPGMPQSVRGVTNLRGSVVPVVDLGIKFGLPEIEVTARTCIVLVDASANGARQLLGLLAQEVGQVMALPRSELLPPPTFGLPVQAHYLEGVLPQGKKFALVLDIDRALSPQEILASVNPEAGEDAAAPDTVDAAETGDADEGWSELDGTDGESPVVETRRA